MSKSNSIPPTVSGSGRPVIGLNDPADPREREKSSVLIAELRPAQGSVTVYSIEQFLPKGSVLGISLRFVHMLGDSSHISCSVSATKANTSGELTLGG